MGGASIRWRGVAALVWMLALADCSCGKDVVVVDAFAAEDVGSQVNSSSHEADSDQLHRYAVGSTLTLFVSGEAVDESITVASSDESVFGVQRATFGSFERFLASNLEVLTVELVGVGAGEAELLLGNANGPLTSRTLTFVDVTRAALIPSQGLPFGLEAPVDLSALAIDNASSFVMRYGDEQALDVEGNGIFTLATEVTFVDDPVAEVALFRPGRDVLRIKPVVEDTRLPWSLVGGASGEVVVVPAQLDRAGVRAHLVTKDEVREALTAHGLDITPTLTEVFDNSDDDRVFCLRDSCAAKAAVEDAAGHTVYGVDTNWSDGAEALWTGDTVMFTHGNDERVLHARVGELHESVVVHADRFTIEVRGTGEDGYCGAVGDDGAGLVGLGLLLLRRRARPGGRR